MKIGKLLLVLCVLAACSREQTAVAGNAAAQSHLEANRDGIIKNWQAKVASTPRCAEFKEQFRAVGTRYDNAANASFSIEMSKIWEAAKKAKCAASP
ncbi:MAG: hypothetical protein Q7S85_00905 [Rugosibacter sp.]|nr:hypothetical protein [Rugosibacter sp.]